MIILKKNLILIVFQCWTLALLSQNENFIRIISPEKDTIETSYSKLNVFGSTLPGAKINVNGIPLTMFPSGAFAGQIDLTEDMKEIKVISTFAGKPDAEKKFILNYKPLVKPSTTQDFKIEYVKMVPNVEQWLSSGDYLKVILKGFPGCKATFLNGKQLFELPDSLTNGVKGIYQAAYLVKPEDTLSLQPLKFILKDSTGRTTEMKTDSKIAFIQQKLPIVGRTKGFMPYLNFGTGTDRLGGAKIGYIDTLINLNITGKQGQAYRVALTANQQAWIFQEFIDLMPQGIFPPNSLTSSFYCYGEEKYDFIKITLSERLPYSSFFEINPTRIVLNVYGASSNSNWLTQHLSMKEIKSVYYQQIEKDLFRVIFELKNLQAWGYQVYYEGTTLVVKVKQTPTSLKLKNLTIALDAGHGGENLGAIGATGMEEKKVNLDLVFRLKKVLESKGATVILTRSEDIPINNMERLKKIFPQQPDILISIHNNAGGNPLKSKGTSTYYKHIAFKPLSVYLYKEMLKTGLSEFGNIGSFNFTLNSPTDFINALVEVAFMSNPEDEMKLMDNNFRDKVVKRITSGLEKFLKDCRKYRR
jgi:N-acetylmuramoyl-L-alanine amidase